MPRIALRQNHDLETIAHTMVKKPAAPKIFAHDGPFRTATAAQVHLGAWLGDPVNIDQLLKAPAETIRPRGTGTIGDIRIDAVLAGMLDALGVDPRAFAIAMTFDPETNIIIGDIDISPLRVESLSLGQTTITGEVELNAKADDIRFEIHRIEMSGSLPETILDACVGLPLRRLVSHRLLDHMDLVVEKAELRGTGTRVFYRPVPDIAIRKWRKGMDAVRGEER